MLLSLTVGLPYGLLASTSPLLQRWYAETGAEYPYRLYAVSNAGSLLALLCYPLLIEPALGITRQAWIWAAVFVAYAAMAGWITWRVQGMEQASPPRLSAGHQPPTSRVAQWLLLSMLPSALLVATTTRVSVDLPALPFLFVIPLATYLLSFIITFDSPRWYQRWLFGPLLLTALWLVSREVASPVAVVAVATVALFACCMCCHGELARSRPETSLLTHFYLWIAVGGALGGMAAALLAPVLLNDYLEFEILLAMIAALVSAMYFRAFWQWLASRLPVVSKRLGAPTAAALGVVVLAAGFYLVGQYSESKWKNQIAGSRSFYGVLRVEQLIAGKLAENRLRLFHGNTLHGAQFSHPLRMRRPTTYYGLQSGVGRAITGHAAFGRKEEAFSIGVIGLGVGTLAAYANPPDKLSQQGGLATDRILFYEIDKAVWDVADNQFSFLQLARNRGVEVEVLLGDARQVMERQLANDQSQQFHVLAIDAFSSDALPVHLLTREAMAVYLAHLREDGVLAFHISNRYIDLLPVMLGLAEDSGVRLLYHDAYLGGLTEGQKRSKWALFTRDQRFVDTQASRLNPRGLEEHQPLLWSDDYSSLLPLLQDDAYDFSELRLPGLD